MITTITHRQPNTLLLEAQSRVCTGPHQTRPLTERDGPDPDQILDIVIASASDPDTYPDPASAAQLGSFLTAMTVRRNFPEATAWSVDELAALSRHDTGLASLPSPFDFLVDPARVPGTNSPADTVLVSALIPILAGNNLTYDQTRRAADAALDPDAHPALTAAFLIGQRMNRETYEEFCGHLDAVFDRTDRHVVNVDALTHIGEPYTGATRFFKPTVFVTAVRAAQGHTTLLHGVDRLPPKFGVTDEQILRFLGADVDLDLDRVARLVEDPNVRFGYVSQRVFAPNAYALRDLRHHIGKRPPWAATEKAQRLLRASGSNAAVIGYYHPGYENLHLRLMRDEDLDTGFLIKGEEGTAQFSLRPREPDPAGRQRVNHVEGFRGDRQTVDALDPQTYGFSYAHSPSARTVTAEAFATEGRAALSGQLGSSFDRILLNAAALNVLLACDPDPESAVAHARETIGRGDALRYLDTYIERSNSV